MQNFVAVLGLFGPAAIIITLIVMALLSQRLGAVTKRAPIYRWFFVSVALIVVGIGGRVVNLFSSPPDSRDVLLATFSDIPMVVGLVLAVVIAWRYWSWLLSERGKGT